MALLDTLKLISEADEPFPLREGTYLDDIHPLVQQAVNEAEYELITIRGGCNWKAMAGLEKHGYRIFPGEQDSFGWLTGCIRTPKGVLVYG